MAPEIIQKTPYDYRVDIWSLGVLLYELIHRIAPYRGRSLQEITKSLAAKTINFSSTADLDAKDLILKILKTNPEERLPLSQILSHPWILRNISKHEPIIKQPMVVQSTVPKSSISQAQNVSKTKKAIFTENTGNKVKQVSISIDQLTNLAHCSDISSLSSIASAKTNTSFNNIKQNTALQSQNSTQSGNGLILLLDSIAKVHEPRKNKIFSSEQPTLDESTASTRSPLVSPLTFIGSTKDSFKDKNVKPFMSFGALSDLRKRENSPPNHPLLIMDLPVHYVPTTTTRFESKRTLFTNRHLTENSPVKALQQSVGRTKKVGIFEQSPNACQAKLQACRCFEWDL